MSGKAAVGALGVVLLAVLIFLAISSWSRQSSAAAAKASVQPINFPHSVHVGTYKMECQYCHSEARRSEYAGLPSVERCMGCHKIAGADKPEIKKLAGYLADKKPIPWVRVNKLPEFTYFPHKAHIRASLKCQTCHGPVETMTTFGATTGPRLTNDLLYLVGLKPGPPPLSMGWCIDCHREQNVAGKQAPLDCVTCHH
ncbi:MAG: cytochrome C [Candidatus Rokuibacteriota bacterium]|nr:MAG: cytochrome C [Candidatus Rokubacteria bacterium]